MKPINVLLLGSGGREHALAWKISQSKNCNKLFIAPGNGGTRYHGTNLDIAINDFGKLKSAVLSNNISLLLVGPEEPLVKGIADFFRESPDTKHVQVIGPGKKAAQLEGSKAFAKAFMKKYNIPTAASGEFTIDNYEEGLEFIRNHTLPIVLKADGLAAGKGVLICNNHLEAQAEFELVIMRSKFGEAGNKVVIEEFLEGIEMSVIILTNGNDFLLLPEAKDYKRVGEKDSGLNTGGMGAISPVPFFSDSLKNKMIEKVIRPTLNGLKKEGFDYLGFIFFGLMVHQDEPMVIEYNCRLGDPETEAILPRIKNDLLDLLLATANNNIRDEKLETDERATATVMAVSGGYPGLYKKGLEIHGLENIKEEETLLFHAGTIFKEDKVFTNGGRVVAATSFGENIREASEMSTYSLEQIFFEDIYFRTDIGYEFRNENSNGTAYTKSTGEN